MSLPFYVGLTLERRKNSLQARKISFQNCFVEKCFPWIVWFLFSIFSLLSSILIRRSYWDHLRDEDIFDALKKAAKKAGLSPVEKILVLSVRYLWITEYVQARYYIDFLLSIFLLYLPSLMPHQTRWKIVTNTSTVFY